MAFYKQIVVDASGKVSSFAGKFHSSLEGKNYNVIISTGVGTGPTKGISLSISYMYDSIQLVVYETSKEDFDKVSAWIEEKNSLELAGYILSKLSSSELMELNNSIYKSGYMAGERDLRKKMRDLLAI